MTATVGPDAAILASYQTEWRTLCAHRHNVLLEGPVASTSAVLRRLLPHIARPLRSRGPHTPLTLPSAAIGALILEEVGTLGADDQTQLLEWLAGGESPTQIVSTTEQPLFPLVMQGLFCAALYYRLNVLLLDGRPSTSCELQNDVAACADRGVVDPTTAMTP